MKQLDWQLTIRELRAVYSDPRALAATGMVGLILGLTGPFHTYELLNHGLRIVYWLLIAYSSFAAAIAGNAVFERSFLPENAPLLLRLPVGSLGASIPVALVVLGWNQVFFDPPMLFRGWSVLVLWLYCLAICLVVFYLIEGLLAPLMNAQPDKAQAIQPIPTIRDRLPQAIRAPLIRMATADHYVDVHTPKGHALVLIRMADAINETQLDAGMQVHHGHWVAFDAIDSLVRDNGKPFLVLKDGSRIPVSRGYLKEVRARLGR